MQKYVLCKFIFAKQKNCGAPQKGGGHAKRAPQERRERGAKVRKNTPEMGKECARTRKEYTEMQQKNARICVLLQKYSFKILRKNIFLLRRKCSSQKKAFSSTQRGVLSQRASNIKTAKEIREKIHLSRGK